MYEANTYDAVMRRMMSRMPDDVDTRVGSVSYILSGPAGWEVSELYRALDQVHALTALPTAPGDYLDTWGWTVGLTRRPALPAKYKFIYEGTPPAVGQRFFHDDSGLYFTAERDEDTDELFLQAEVPGATNDRIAPETKAVPVTTVQGLKVAQFGALIEPGVDTEPDSEYRMRVREKLAGPAENGNRQHYKTWCESVEGVGRAKIVSLFAGRNTVMGVLFDTEGKPAAQSVADRVQEYIDPITEGVTVEYNGETVVVGDGRGDGVANIGAHFLAVPGGSAYVTVEFTPTLRGAATIEMARAQAELAIGDYFRLMTLNSMDASGVVVRRHDIGAILMDLPAIADYDHLRLNGVRANIPVPLTDAPLLQEVIVHEAV